MIALFMASLVYAGPAFVIVMFIWAGISGAKSDIQRWQQRRREHHG